MTQVNKLTALIPYTSTCELNMVIPATPAGIHMVSEGVMQLLQRKHWGEDDIIKIDLALQEALANGIRHGCKGDPTKSVQCSVTCDENGELMIVVRDPGPGFDLSQVANPLDSENMLKPSGRGVFLINQLMDQVAFADGGREVQDAQAPRQVGEVHPGGADQHGHRLGFRLGPSVRCRRARHASRRSCRWARPVHRRRHLSARPSTRRWSGSPTATRSRSCAPVIGSRCASGSKASTRRSLASRSAAKRNSFCGS